MRVPVALVGLLVTAGLVATGLAGCTDSPGPSGAPDSSGSSDSPGSTTRPQGRETGGSPGSGTVRVAGTVADGLTTPWGIAFLPDDSALVSERDTGAIVRITASGSKATVGTVPGVEAGGEGGLLGLAVSPSYASDHLVYAYLTSATDNRIVRMRLTGDELDRPEPILDGIPKAAVHNGGRIRFGPDGMLYAGTGDGTDGQNSQDPSSLGGKILRITPDGSPAPGNPDPDSPVWSLGHRNVQGLAFDRGDRLWASEFGQDTWDELNRIRPGRNYGWPEVEGKAGDDRFVDPLVQWHTDQASPSGLAYARGALWMACLRGERLWRIPVSGGKVAGEPKAFLSGKYGRLRTVTPAPDGSLWLTTSNTDGRGDPRDHDDRILRLEVS